jgi:hypothetical protein
MEMVLNINSNLQKFTEIKNKNLIFSSLIQFHDIFLEINGLTDLL